MALRPATDRPRSNSFNYVFERLFSTEAPADRCPLPCLDGHMRRFIAHSPFVVLSTHSADGRCELDDKECFWARIYERLKYYGESETMLDRPVTLYNATLKNTSSWVNTYLDKDHHAPKK